MAQIKRPAHRPSAYKPEYATIAFQMALIGATDAELGMAFSVSEQTINSWKHRYPKFLESIKEGKLSADSNVAASLYKRALGFSAPDLHIGMYEGRAVLTPIEKYYPPDVAAAIFFLKNRRPAQFRQNPEMAVTVNNEVSVDMSKPPEEWGLAEIREELKRRGALPMPPERNGNRIPVKGK